MYKVTHAFDNNIVYFVGTEEITTPLSSNINH